MAKSQTDPAADMHAVLREVCLVSPSCSYWRGQYTLPRGEQTIKIGQSTITVDSSDSDDGESLSVPRANLLQEKHPVDVNGVPWKKRFQSLDRELKKLVNSFSIPFESIRGVRIVPRVAYEEFAEKLESLREQILAAGLEFQRQWESADDSGIYNQLKARTDPTIWQCVRGRLPTTKALGDKFSVDAVPIQLGSQTMMSGSNADDAAPIASRVLDRGVRRKLDEAVELIVSRPREELGAALDKLSETLSAGQRITSRTFNAVSAAISKMQLFRFVMTPQMSQQLGTLERSIASAREDVMGGVLQQNIAALHEAIRQASAGICDIDSISAISA